MEYYNANRIAQWMDTKKEGNSKIWEDLSWQCWQHVGDTLAMRQKVAKFGSTCMSVPTQKVPQHKNFALEITNKL
jgi:hypothetical protein